MNNIARLQEEGKLENINDEYFKNYKACMYLLNAKPDSETRIFNLGKRIYEKDIENLNEQIDEKLSKHNIDNLQTKVYVSLDKKGALEFNDFREFQQYKWHNNSNEVKTVVIEKDFYLQLAKYKFPQRHVLKIRIGSTLKPHEFISLMFQNDTKEEELEIEISDVICRIDFIDHVVSKELFNIVSEWYELVGENRKKKDLWLFLQKNKKSVCLLTFSLVLIAQWVTIYLGMIYFLKKVYESINLEVAIIFIMFCIVFGLISNLISKQVTNSIYNRLSDESNEKIIILTERDKQLLKETKEGHKKRLKGVLVKGCVCFIYDIFLIYLGYILTK